MYVKDSLPHPEDDTKSAQDERSKQADDQNITSDEALEQVMEKIDHEQQ